MPFSLKYVFEEKFNAAIILIILSNVVIYIKLMEIPLINKKEILKINNKKPMEKK